MIGEFNKFDQGEGNKQNFKFVRCRVWLDVSKPIVTEFLLARRGKEPLRITVRYEHIPRFCHHCGVWSHETEECEVKNRSMAPHYEAWLKALKGASELMVDSEAEGRGEPRRQMAKEVETLAAEAGTVDGKAQTLAEVARVVTPQWAAPNPQMGQERIPMEDDNVSTVGFGAQIQDLCHVEKSVETGGVAKPRGKLKAVSNPSREKLKVRVSKLKKRAREAPPGAMKTLCWNCRGLGQPRTVRSLADLVRCYKPQVVGLIETKSNNGRVEALRRRLGFDCGLGVDSNGSSGGLALWWKEEIRLTVRSYSSYHIDCDLEVGERVRLTIFYGNPVTNRRSETWNLLRRLSQDSDQPWVVMGDFNEVLFSWEVKGRRLRREWQMRSFRETIEACGLVDLGYTGLPFTFSNRRSGLMETKARLDRAFSNIKWKTLFERYEVSHLITSSSDHLPLLVNFRKRISCVRRNLFRFEPMWLRHNDFRGFLEECWGKLEQPNHDLNVKLKGCGRELARWNRAVFGKVQKRIAVIKNQIELLKSNFRSEAVIEREAKLHKELDEWLAREELLWRQRSRVEWLREGDANTKFFHSRASFFHSRASQRKKKNTVERIKGNNNEWITDEIDICEEAVKHFQISKVRCMVAELNKAGFRFVVSKPESADQWCPPEPGCFKISCDGAWNPGTREAGIGVECRDSEGCVEFVEAVSLSNHGCILDVEGIAMKRGMELAAERKLSRVIFVSDNAEVTHLLLSSSCSAKGGAWLQGCVEMLESNALWRVEHALRGANQVADLLARKARDSSWFWNISCAIPLVLSAVVQSRERLS
ncbi:hypothetical protein QQ045_017904 [Rhodiola kirilowii]